jgi:hypothetical protein
MVSSRNQPIRHEWRLHDASSDCPRQAHFRISPTISHTLWEGWTISDNISLPERKQLDFMDYILISISKRIDSTISFATNVCTDIQIWELTSSRIHICTTLQLDNSGTAECILKWNLIMRDSTEICRHLQISVKIEIKFWAAYMKACIAFARIQSLILQTFITA